MRKRTPPPRVIVETCKGPRCKREIWMIPVYCTGCHGVSVKLKTGTCQRCNGKGEIRVPVEPILRNSYVMASREQARLEGGTGPGSKPWQWKACAEQGYISHFISCPDRDSFRRKP